MQTCSGVSRTLPGLAAQETPEVPKAEEKVAEDKPKEEPLPKESEKGKDGEKAKEEKPAEGEKGKDADKSKEKEKPKEKKKKQYKVDEELLLAFRFIDKNGEHFGTTCCKICSGVGLSVYFFPLIHSFYMISPLTRMSEHFNFARSP
jgi:hypothetical protein